MTEPSFVASRQAISLWIRGRIADYARVPLEAVHASEPLTAYGLDSVYALTLSDELEQQLGITISATLLWDTPSIADLVERLFSATSAVAAG